MGKSVFYGENIGHIYRRIGYMETAEFYCDIEKIIENKNIVYAKENLDDLLPDNRRNRIDEYYIKYVEECQKI